ncbi:ATP-binding protein [Candidatus Solincola tengchongensis]|uniref:ATP-binding protein n=1 Tax=Candidatus Solincola tengchongensis TaxID=2900693 RepID=UPI00257A398E|nr:ATP-binding protein [Candidatus Solincola tengchongensis]
MSGDKNVAFELEIPANAKYISLARLFAGSIARRMNFSEDSVDDLKIAVSEMCTNAVVHTGNGTAEKPPINIRFIMGEESLTVEVQDRGPGFDPRCVLESPPSELLEKGFGIPLIRSLVDVFECQSSPGGGTKVTITKFLPGRERG